MGLTDPAFDDLGFEELVFSNALGNRRSHNIKVRTGAELIGSEPASFNDPAYTQRELWRLTKTRWREWQNAGGMTR